eukprot:3515053-Rhodomonas_salina.2
MSGTTIGCRSYAVAPIMVPLPYVMSGTTVGTYERTPVCSSPYRHQTQTYTPPMRCAETEPYTACAMCTALTETTCAPLQLEGQGPQHPRGCPRLHWPPRSRTGHDSRPHSPHSPHSPTSPTSPIHSPSFSSSPYPSPSAPFPSRSISLSLTLILTRVSRILMLLLALRVEVLSMRVRTSTSDPLILAQTCSCRGVDGQAQS